MSVTTSDLVEFTVSHPSNARARDQAALAILDTLAVLAAGRQEEVVIQLERAIPGGASEAAKPSLSGGSSLAPEGAALLYGAGAHALDFDDVCMLAICHPSAPILAALLASAKWSNLTGPALCDAHAIGTEIMIRLGQAIGFGHYERGFHTTATMGVFGAVAALARLHKLEPATTATAFGIAASLVSGLRSNFGTMMKPMHVGIAASNAVRAVAWAQAGIESSSEAIFGSAGLFAAYSDTGSNDLASLAQLGKPFAIVTPGFERKRYPCCYLLHKIIALGIEASRSGVRLTDIAGMRVKMPRGGTQPLRYPQPKDGNEAKFSGPYALLAAINDGEVGFATFEDDAVARAEIRSLLTSVELIEVGEQSLLTAEQIGAAPVRLDITMTDGSVRRLERLAAPGSADDPILADELRAKWTNCFKRSSGGEAEGISSSGLYDDGLRRLQNGDLGPWLEAVWATFAPLSSAQREECCQ